jgi:hypothetical protein
MAGSRRLLDFLRDASEWVRSGPVKYRENRRRACKRQGPFLGMLQSKNLG